MNFKYITYEEVYLSIEMFIKLNKDILSHKHTKITIWMNILLKILILKY